MSISCLEAPDTQSDEFILDDTFHDGWKSAWKVRTTLKEKRQKFMKCLGQQKDANRYIQSDTETGLKGLKLHLSMSDRWRYGEKVDSSNEPYRSGDIAGYEQRECKVRNTIIETLIEDLSLDNTAKSNIQELIQEDPAEALKILQARKSGKIGMIERVKNGAAKVILNKWSANWEDVRAQEHDSEQYKNEVKQEWVKVGRKIGNVGSTIGNSLKSVGSFFIRKQPTRELFERETVEV